jgi:hypothetical protein
MNHTYLPAARHLPVLGRFGIVCGDDRGNLMMQRAATGKEPQP